MRLQPIWWETIKQRVPSTTSPEAIIHRFQREEAQITSLVEQHFPLVSRRFNVYTPERLHKGWVTRDNAADEPVYKDPLA